MQANFNELSPTEWETERGGFDFHIRLEQDDYVFDSAIESADAAHLTAHTCDTWADVLAFCTHYDGITVV